MLTMCFKLIYQSFSDITLKSTAIIIVRPTSAYKSGKRLLCVLARGDVYPECGRQRLEYIMQGCEVETCKMATLLGVIWQLYQNFNVWR